MAMDIMTMTNSMTQARSSGDRADYLLHWAAAANPGEAADIQAGQVFPVWLHQVQVRQHVTEQMII